MKLTGKERDVFFDAILNPKTPSDRAMEAAARALVELDDKGDYDFMDAWFAVKAEGRPND